VEFFVAESSLSGAAGGLCGFAWNGRCEHIGDEFGESLAAGCVIACLIAKSLAGDLQYTFF
jgi:hypothetical protein